MFFPCVQGPSTKGKGTTTNYASEDKNFDNVLSDFSCFFTPNGSASCPVRCCFDLFQDYPHYNSGGH